MLLVDTLILCEMFQVLLSIAVADLGCGDGGGGRCGAFPGFFPDYIW